MQLQQALKATIVLASSAIVIPYAVALIANMVCGWPMRRDRYRRALNPRKVYALNYAILLELTKVRFIMLYWRWQRFYNSASKEKVIKDIPFGSNDNFLDVYLAGQDERSSETREKPVIIFVYGGAWGSGDKSMYGLLCSNLAEKLKAVVVCPNYSTFPKGFVDDMVQDIGEAIQWVRRHAHNFGGNKKEIILMGHSAGAHLAALTVLELCIKQLVRDENSLLLSAEEVAEAESKGDSLELSFVGLSSSASAIKFEEQYFNGNESSEGQGDGRSIENRQSVVTPLKVGGQGDASAVLESFCIVEKPEEEEGAEGYAALPEDVLEIEENKSKEEVDSTGSEGEEEEISKRTSIKELAVATLDEAEDSFLSARSLPSVAEETDKQVESRSTEEEDDLLPSIKLIIGLAGVYDIVEHFEYESQRGVEDISTMARAMYDPKHFEQFSPTFLAKALPPNIRLPPFHLFHGDIDYTVPVSSSVRFGEALWARGIRSVQVVILPGCSHYNIFLDLMEKRQQWHNLLLAEIQHSLSLTIH